MPLTESIFKQGCRNSLLNCRLKAAVGRTGYDRYIMH